MYTATVTSQRQMSIPAKLMDMIGLMPGEKVDLSVVESEKSKMILVKPSSDWESLRGVLKKYTKIRRYPTQKEIAKAWSSGYEKSSR